VTAIVAIVWAVIGFVAGMFVLSELGGLFGIPGMEGQQGMFGLFAGGPLGALCGVMFGLLVARKSREDPRTARWLVVGTLSVLLGVPLAIYLVEMFRTWDHLDAYGDTYGLSYQVRLPEGAPSPAGAKIGVRLFSSKESPDCDIYDYPYGLTQEGGRYLVSGQCKIRYVTPERTLGIRIGGGATRYFKVRVQSRPVSATYSEWFTADEVDDHKGGRRRPPRPDEILEFRYGAR
jgi:hypothetical protein